MREEKKERKNTAYMLRCADGTFYCGWTNCLDKRLKAHNEGKGAKYTKGRRPVEVAYYEEFATKEEAMQREAAMKKLSRKEKKLLAAAFLNKGSGDEKIHHHIMAEASAHDKEMEDLM